MMNHTYFIRDMICNGCRRYLEETLSKVEGALNAIHDLEKAEAAIVMESPLAIETFK